MTLPQSISRLVAVDCSGAMRRPQIIRHALQHRDQFFLLADMFPASWYYRELCKPQVCAGLSSRYPSTGSGKNRVLALPIYNGQVEDAMLVL